MEITIIDPNENKNIHLRIPNRIVFSTLSLSIIEKALKHSPNLTTDSQTIHCLLKEMSHMNHQYKGLEIIDIQSKDGEIIKITL